MAETAFSAYDEAGAPSIDIEDHVLNRPDLDLVITDHAGMGRFEKLNQRRQERPETCALPGFDVLASTRLESTVEPGRRPYRKVSVGGTFNSLHRGHHEYLKLAFGLADTVHIFLASDRYAVPRKSYAPRKLAQRREKLTGFLKENGCLDRAQVEILHDVQEIEAYVCRDEELDLVLAEWGYIDWFTRWNDIRMQADRRPYDVLSRKRTTMFGRDISSSLWQSKTAASKQVVEKLPLF